MKILIPKTESLQKYNSIIEPLCLKMYKNIEESLHLSQLRDTLLPKLMNGEIEI